MLIFATVALDNVYVVALWNLNYGRGRCAPANPSFERTPLRGFARVSLRALRALRPHAGAAQLAPR